MSQQDNVRNKLLAKYNPDEIAIWHIKGEDANCDIGGYHSQPSLGYFQGKYKHIIEHAMALPRFFTWGGGGDIERIAVQKVDDKTAQQLIDARERVRRLDDELHNAKETLKRLGGE